MADNLPALVQALPVELYDEIRHLSFIESGSNRPLIIDDSYKPSAALQVDRTSRIQFAKSYYHNTLAFCISSRLAAKWIGSLPERHLKLIRDIKLLNVAADSSFLDENGHTQQRQKDMLTINGLRISENELTVLRDLWCLSDSIKPDIVKVRVNYGDGGYAWVAFGRVMRGGTS